MQIFQGRVKDRIHSKSTTFETRSEMQRWKSREVEKFKGIPRVGGAWNVISLLFPARGTKR